MKIFSFAKDWRMDRYLRRLEAMMIANSNQILIVSGTGSVIGAPCIILPQLVRKYAYAQALLQL